MKGANTPHTCVWGCTHHTLSTWQYLGTAYHSEATGVTPCTRYVKPFHVDY